MDGNDLIPVIIAGARTPLEPDPVSRTVCTGTRPPNVDATDVIAPHSEP